MSSDMLATVKMPAYSPRAAGVVPVSSEQQKIVAQGPKDAVPSSEKVLDLEAVKNAARAVESYLKSIDRKLEFRIDDASGQMVVSVLDAETGDLIRQVPGEVVLRMARALKEDPVSLVDVLV